MKYLTLSLFIGVTNLSPSLMVTAIAAPSIGTAAPDFSLKDITGKTVNLADYKGKQVVLEWLNPNCPFVKKHYEQSSNMQDTQRDALGRKDTVWLAINSTNPSHQDYMTPAALGAWMKERKGPAVPVLMDESGATGKAYGAKTTPHMYIISAKGVLLYAGAIDSIRSASASDIPKAVNYVKIGLAQTGSGKEISQATSVPYGCSVKYKD
jgi:AhpC/TSA family